MKLLPKGFRVKEVVRPETSLSVSRDEHDAMTRQYRRERQKRESAWNDGFQACVKMIEGGATVERLKAALIESPVPVKEMSDGIPRFAKGTRDFEKEDTEPYITRIVADIDMEFIHTDMDMDVCPSLSFNKDTEETIHLGLDNLDDPP